jgi:hypothetical protein
MGLSLEDANKVKGFVNSLPDNKKKEFIDRYNALDTAGKEKVAANVLSSIPQEKPEVSGADDWLAENAGALSAGGALLGTGLLGRYAVKTARRPYVELMKPLEQELANLQSTIPGFKGTSPRDFPQLVGGKIGELKSNLRLVDSNAKIASSKLNTMLDNFNKDFLSKDIDQLAMKTKVGMPDFFKSAYNGYNEGLNAIEEFMASKNVSLTGQDMKGLIDDTITSAIKRGIPETKVKAILKSTQKIGSQNVVPFKQAKSIIGNVAKQLDIEGLYDLNGKWGKFLETYAPPEVSQQLAKINSGYEPFTKARNKLNSIAKMKSGQYDIEGIKKFFLDYAKNKYQSDKDALIKLLGEGSDIVSPIKGIKEGVGKIKAGAGKINTLEKAIDTIANSSLLKKRAILEKIDELGKLANRSEELLSKQAALRQKYPIRLGIPSKLADIAESAAIRGLVFKGLRSAAPQLALGALDPTSALLGKEFGISDPVKIIDYLTGKEKPTPEEIKKALEKMAT